MKRRSRHDIYMDTLETVRRTGLSGITRISYGANLPVDRAKKIIEFFIQRDLVREEEYGDIRGFRLTARGGKFLQALKTVKIYTDSNEESIS